MRISHHWMLKKILPDAMSGRIGILIIVQEITSVLKRLILHSQLQLLLLQVSLLLLPLLTCGYGVSSWQLPSES